MSDAANKTRVNWPDFGWHLGVPRLVSKKNRNAKIASVFADSTHTGLGMTQPGNKTTLEQGHRHDAAAKPDHGWRDGRR